MSERFFTAHVVPLMGDDENQLFAEPVDLTLFNEAVIKELEEILEVFSPVVSNIRGAANKSHAVADIITAFFKAPLMALLRPPLIFEGIEADVELSDRRAEGFNIRPEARKAVFNPLVVRREDGAKICLPDPSGVFWAWLLARRLLEAEEKYRRIHECFESEEIEEHLAGLVALFLNELRGIYERLFIELRLLGHEKHQKLWRAFLNIPQDTRPGPNASKLVPHLLATSAIACSIWMARSGKGGEIMEKLKLELAILRLASLLHDVGKPNSWLSVKGTEIEKAHPDESARLAGELLRKAGLPEDVIEAVCALIRNHHPRPPGRLPDLRAVSIEGIDVDLKGLLVALIEADHASSALDRLAEISAEAIAPVLGEDEARVKEMLTKSGKEIWRYWLSKDPKLLRKASEEAAKHMLKLSEEYSILALAREPKYVKGVCVIALDVMGIQEFIYREKLPAVVGASYAVDLMTLYALPRALVQVLGLPPECIIYAGGGMVYAIAPDLGEGVLAEVVRRAEQILGDVELYVACARARLYENWPATALELNAKLEEDKRTRSPESPLELGIEVLCDICHRRPAERPRKGEERERDYICRECRALRRLGYPFHFRAKVEWLRALGESLAPEWDRLRSWVLEWLSGCESEAEPAKNIAIVKADGNMMGSFMAQAISISDAILRSARIDRSMKLALFEAMRSILTSSAEEQEELGEPETDVARMFVGLLYSGGDDTMAIWPARVALQATSAICYWFWRGLGGLRQPSVGLASGKPKHNIWALIRTAEELMEICKSKLRRALHRANLKFHEVMPGIAGLFAAIYADTHVPLPCWAHEQAMGALLGPGTIEAGLTWQPLAFLTHIRPDKGGERAMDELVWLGLPNAWRIFSLLADIEGESMLKSRVRRVFEHFRLAARGARWQAPSARDLRAVVREVHAANMGLGQKTDVFISFLVNRALKAKERRKRVYAALAKMALELGMRSSPPLADVFNLAKFVLGE